MTKGSHRTRVVDRAVHPGGGAAGSDPGRSTQFGGQAIRNRLRNGGTRLLVLPLYLIILLIVALPLGYLAYTAFRSGSPGSPNAYYTLDNLREAVAIPSYRTVLTNTLKLAVVVTLVSTALGVAMAWLVARTNLPSKRTLELLIPAPLFLSPFAGGVAWVFLGSEGSGLINVAYRYIFGTDEPLINIYSFPGLVFTMVLFMTPYAYLFTVGPLQNMDATLEDASRAHGASYWRTTFRITFSLVLPGITSAVLMIFVLSSEMFSIPGLLGGPAEYYTLPYFIFLLTSQTPANWPLAAAMGIMLLLIMIVGVSLQRRATRASARFVTVGGKGAKTNQVDIGRWRWLGATLCYGYCGLALLLPVVALLTGSVLRYFTSSLTFKLFTLENWERVLTSEQFLSALRNTLIVAAIGPLLCLVIGFVLSYLWLRLKAPFKRSFEMLAMLPIAVPGIVMGIGVVWAFVATPIYGTLAIFIVAYVARYLPHSLRMFQSTLVQFDSSLDEASRVSGARILRTWRHVTLPLMKHSALAAWLLLFILMFRELNIAIMVYSSGTAVIPVLLYSQITGGQYGAAAVIAIVEVSIIAITFILARRLLGINLVTAMAQRD